MKKVYLKVIFLFVFVFVTNGLTLRYRLKRQCYETYFDNKAARSACSSASAKTKQKLAN